MQKKIFTKILPLLILVAAALIFALLLFTKPKTTYEEKPEKAWLVTAQEIKADTYTPQLLLYGTIESPQTSELESTIEANVVATPVKEGSLVKKEQLLIELDDREAKLIFQQKEAEVGELEAMISETKIKFEADKEAVTHQSELLKIAELNVRRRETLKKSLAGSAFDLDTAREELQRQRMQVNKMELEVENYDNKLLQLQARLRKAEAVRDQASIDLARAQIKSPFDGRITQLYVAVGERVIKGEDLIQLFNTSDVEIRAQIPTTYLPRFIEAREQNQTIEAFGIFDHRPIKIQLVRLAGQVGSGRAGVDGLFKINSPHKHLAIGRTVPIYVNLPQAKNVFAVPSQALYGSNTIYKIVDDHLVGVKINRVGAIITEEVLNLRDEEKSSIEERAEIDQLTLITAPELKDGDMIVVSQLPNAITGLKVKVLKE